LHHLKNRLQEVRLRGRLRNSQFGNQQQQREEEDFETADAAETDRPQLREGGNLRILLPVVPVATPAVRDTRPREGSLSEYSPLEHGAAQEVSEDEQQEEGMQSTSLERAQASSPLCPSHEEELRNHVGDSLAEPQEDSSLWQGVAGAEVACSRRSLVPDEERDSHDSLEMKAETLAFYSRVQEAAAGSHMDSEVP